MDKFRIISKLTAIKREHFQTSKKIKNLIDELDKSSEKVQNIKGNSKDYVSRNGEKLFYRED